MEEWRDPKESGQPLIIIEGYLNEPTHVYVIWDQWRGMNQAERSEIIMDALEGLDGEHRIQNLDLVTVAMGLTAEEARRMGIEPG